LLRDELSKRIHLPVGIGNFTWFGGEKTPLLYAHAQWNNANSSESSQVSSTVCLYNANGNLLGLLERPEFIETTVGDFLRNLTVNQKIRLPGMWEVLWKSNPLSNEIRIKLSALKLPSPSSPELTSLRLETLLVDPDFVVTRSKLKMNESFIYVLLRAATECGWGLSFGGTFKVSHIRKLLPPKLQSLKILEAWIQVLVREAYIKELEGYESSEFLVIRPLPDVPECNRVISSLIDAAESSHNPVDATVSFGKRIGEKYTAVLQGRMEPLELLFPEDGADVGAARLYNEHTRLAISAILDCVKSSQSPGVWRMLEVGGGTGAITKSLLSKFLDLNMDVYYTFTDVSPHFLTTARNEFVHFQGTSVSLGYTLFNIEEDPLRQGIQPEHFDFMFAFNVLLATKDLGETLTNLKTVLRPGGILFLMEQFKSFDVISFSFGLLEGWWRASDFRKGGPLIDGPAWARCLVQAGFTDVFVIDELDQFAGLAFGRAPETKLVPSRALTAKDLKIPAWLLFGDGTSLVECVGNKLEAYARDPIIVAQDFSMLVQGTNQCDSMFSSMASSKREVEGIIYFSTRLDSDVLGTAGNVANPEKILPLGLLNACQSYLSFIKTTLPRKPPRFVGLSRGLLPGKCK